jgi:hypothetical protein
VVWPYGCGIQGHFYETVAGWLIKACDRICVQGRPDRRGGDLRWLRFGWFGHGNGFGFGWFGYGSGFRFGWFGCGNRFGFGWFGYRNRFRFGWFGHRNGFRFGWFRYRNRFGFGWFGYRNRFRFGFGWSLCRQLRLRHDAHLSDIRGQVCIGSENEPSCEQSTD